MTPGRLRWEIEVQPQVQAHIEAIGALFVEGVHLTLVMRNPANPDEGGFVVTDEHQGDLPEVIAELKRRWFQ